MWKQHWTNFWEMFSDISVRCSWRFNQSWLKLLGERGSVGFYTPLYSVAWIRGEGKNTLFSELLSTSQISCKIKYCVFLYYYFINREKESLQPRRIVAPSGGIQICSYEEREIGFASGKREGASTARSQQKGERRGERRQWNGHFGTTWWL